MSTMSTVSAMSCDTHKGLYDDPTSYSCSLTGDDYPITPSYLLGGKVASGAYSTVFDVEHILQTKKYAAKMMSVDCHDTHECKRMIRELSLHMLFQSVFPHSVVNIVDVIYSSQPNSTRGVAMVMRKHHMNLRQYINNVMPINGSTNHQQIDLMHKILYDINNMHHMHIVHRDIKPDNFLVNVDGNNIPIDCVVCDMGMARQFVSPDCTDTYMWTHYVTTRWYRAPEMCDQFIRGCFATASDVWSIGCMLFEIATGKVLFRGNTEVEQCESIIKIIGRPPPEFIKEYASARCDEAIQIETWIKNLQQMTTIRAQIDRHCCWDLASRIKLADLIQKMVTWMPSDRITIEKALDHELFADILMPEARKCLSLKKSSTLQQDVNSVMFDDVYLSKEKSEELLIHACVLVKNHLLNMALD